MFNLTLNNILLGCVLMLTTNTAWKRRSQAIHYSHGSWAPSPHSCLKAMLAKNQEPFSPNGFQAPQPVSLHASCNILRPQPVILHAICNILGPQPVSLHAINLRQFLFVAALLDCYLYIYFCLSLNLCVSLSASLCLYLSIHPSLYLFISPSIHLSICLSICLSIYLSIYLSNQT